jgi:hypothetical protein
MLNRCLVHMRNAAQRWFKFHNVGPSPHSRTYHALASDGTRVFVLGGYSAGARADEISFIHVFDTSTYVRFVNLSGQPSKLRTQSTSSSTRNPSVTLSILMRRPPNLRGSHPEVLGPWSNHSTRNPLHRRPTVLRSRLQNATPAVSGRPASLQITHERNPVRMIGHWNSRVRVSCMPRCVPEDDVGEGSTEYHASPRTPPSKEALKKRPQTSPDTNAQSPSQSHPP